LTGIQNQTGWIEGFRSRLACNGEGEKKRLLRTSQQIGPTPLDWTLMGKAQKENRAEDGRTEKSGEGPVIQKESTSLSGVSIETRGKNERRKGRAGKGGMAALSKGRSPKRYYGPVTFGVLPCAGTSGDQLENKEKGGPFRKE